MYNAKGRYIILSIFIIIALVSALYFKQYQLASVAMLFACYVIWSHYKHSSVVMASQYFKNKDYEKTKRYLAEVPNPDRLAKNRRGYYEFMLANIALKEERFEEAELHFQIASKFPLGNKNDKSYVLIHLATLALRSKDRERAEAYVNRAKDFAVTQRSKDIIQQLEKEILKLS